MEGSGRTWEYRRLLGEAREGGDVGRLVDALELIPDVIAEAVEGVRREVGELKAQVEKLSSEVGGLKALYERLAGEVGDLRALYERLAGSVEGLERQYSDLNRRVAGLEVTVGGLAEAVLSRVVLDELRAAGYRVKGATRNYRLDGEDIDLLVVAERDGVEEHFIVEVKVKPSHSDVGALLAKADLYALRAGVRPRPVLAGVWVGGEVEAYARSRGAVVFKL